MSDPRRTHNHPAAALLDRIVDHARENVQHDHPSVSDLVTDLATSLLVVLVLCRETLLDQKRLARITLAEEPWQFFQRLEPSRRGDMPLPTTVGGFISFIRNGLAHGNMNLDPGVDLLRSHTHGVTFEIPVVFTFRISPDFYGIDIWENYYRGPLSGQRKRGTVLKGGDMWDLIVNLQKLSHDKQYWSKQSSEWSSCNWRWSCDEGNEDASADQGEVATNADVK